MAEISPAACFAVNFALGQYIPETTITWVRFTVPDASQNLSSPFFVELFSNTRNLGSQVSSKLLTLPGVYWAISLFFLQI